MPSPVASQLWEGLKRRAGVLSFQQPQLVDDVFGMYELGDSPLDMLWHQGWTRRYHQDVVAAGGAGQYGYVGLRLLDPLTILVCEGVWASAAGVWEVDSTAEAVAATSLHVALDWRSLSQPASNPAPDKGPSRCVSGTSGTAPIGLRQVGFNIGFNPFQFVLTPGAGGSFLFKFTTANAAAALGFQWRERPADATELQR
jgi:hypothetical protein